MAKTNERTLRLEMALHHLTNQVIACCQALMEATGRPGCEELSQDVVKRLLDYAFTAKAALDVPEAPLQQVIPNKRRSRPKKAPAVDGQFDGLPEEEPANAS